MNTEASTKFLSAQKDSVARIGAVITEIQAGINQIDSSDGDVVNEGVVRRMLPILNEFRINLGLMTEFYAGNSLDVYSREVSRQIARLSNRFGEQTLPSKARSKDVFCNESYQNIEALGEVMIATAKLVPPTIDLNIKAGNAFTAYVLLSDLIEQCVSTLLIVDPYIEESLFYRYLYRASTSVKITVFSDSRRLKGDQLARFESVEALFKKQYPLYNRELRNDLHDRYLITDECAYSLGGSIKDAANKADYSVIQVSNQKRDELCTTYS